MEGVPPGAGGLMASEITTRSFSNPRRVVVSAGGEQTMDLELAYAGEVKGTVVDQTGTIVAGVYVRMDLTSGGDMCEAMTDAKGQFDCASLSGGTYIPTVAPLPGGRQGLAPATGDHFDPLEIPPDGIVSMVTLAIRNERLSIRGTVIDDVGAPVPDVQVEALGHGDSTMDPPSTMTDTNGHFEIGELAGGNYTVQARVADGSETELHGVAAGGAPISIVLARAGAIEGTLVGFSGTPDVFTYLLGQNTKLTRAIVDGTHFSTIGLAPGRYSIEATAGAAVDAQQVDVHAGETVKVTLQDRAPAASRARSPTSRPTRRSRACAATRSCSSPARRAPSHLHPHSSPSPTPPVTIR